MMRSVALLLMTTVALPVAAQTPDANTQAILDALKGINARLDTIEQRIDRVEGQAPAAMPTSPSPQASAPAPAASATAAAAPAQTDMSAPPPGMTVQPGWLIGALPFDRDNPEPEALFYFPSKSAFTLNDHMRSTSSGNWVRYKGEAKFNAYTPGRYQFSINITAGPPQTAGNNTRSQAIHCWGYFKANDQQIASIGDAQKDLQILSGRTQSFSGAIDLEEGNYDLVFRVSCTPNWGDSRQDPKDYYTGNLDQMWRATKVTVTVRTPQDLSPRLFTARELFFFAPEGAAAQAGPPAPAPGDRRSLLSSLNVRRTASTTAPIAAKLAPGDALEVVSLTPDQEWVEVSMNGRTLGFVKVTALNTNSR